MRFALLGADSESVALARAAVAAGHDLVWCGDLVEESDLPSGWSLDDQGGLWEALLDSNHSDGVLVGRGRLAAQERSEQIGQLVKSGVPILTSFPVVDAVLSYYEIDMARSETGVLLQHYNPLSEQHQIIAECARWIAEGHDELGPIEQVVWERPLANRTQSAVLWHFARDVELLSLVAGKLNRLGALGSPDQAATYAGLSVQLLGKSEVPVRWQVGPIEESPVSRLTLIAQHGKLTVEFDESGSALRHTLSTQGRSDTAPLDPPNSASMAIERFANAANHGDGSASTWSRALAAMELADTIEISLRRGRMIEVHQQQLTEQLAFKGTMSALGCGVLLVVPPLLLCFGWIAELVGLSVARYWPHALLGLLALFLAVQLLPKLVFSNSTDGKPSEQ